MHKNLYSIYDTVAEIFNNPFTELNDNSAKRSFFRSLEEVPHKNDYVLYSVGAYNDNDGLIFGNQLPVKIISGFEANSNVASITPEMQRQDLKNESCS